MQVACRFGKKVKENLINYNGLFLHERSCVTEPLLCGENSGENSSYAQATEGKMDAVRSVKGRRVVSQRKRYTFVHGRGLIANERVCRHCISAMRLAIAKAGQMDTSGNRHKGEFAIRQGSWFKSNSNMTLEKVILICGVVMGNKRKSATS